MDNFLNPSTDLGELHVPPTAVGVVVMAANRDKGDALAAALHEAHLATLRLGAARGTSPANLSRAQVRGVLEQLLAATDWIGANSALSGLPLGVFGADAGGSAALAAATARPNAFRAIVARDGQPSLAGSALGRVCAATLLIVDGQNEAGIAFSQDAMTRVQGIAELEILTTAGTSFDDTDTRVHVARLAQRWFSRFLP